MLGLWQTEGGDIAAAKRIHLFKFLFCLTLRGFYVTTLAECSCVTVPGTDP